AAQRGLAVAAKPDSHDICFIADGDTAGFLRDRLGPEPGDVLDEGGRVLGRHDGAYAYTVGQRRGLQIGTPAADGWPRYVLDIEPATHTVTVGPRESLDVDRIVAIRPRWCGAMPHRPLTGTVQLRAHGEQFPATTQVEHDRVTVDLHRPAQGVAPGQAVVIYDGSRVVGSATIDRTEAPART
ncbi:MAG TPA: tRNA methyl transferase PRC-barrel domain-containing protein, partial [Nocardioidaceae bacterium]|nr:tRNA methyl transferase PRC-barrel domain-containing protein [Nocardioidaceae bacterium]